MSEYSSHSFEQNESLEPGDRFAPDSIDDTIVAYQTPNNPRDDSARLVAALVATYKLPAGGWDVLKRVHQRVLRTADDATAPSPGVDAIRREHEKEVVETRTVSRPVPSTQSPMASRFRRDLAPVAAVLIVTLLVGGFFALFRYQTPSGTGGNGTSRQYTAFPLPASLEAPMLTSGPDGTLWFYAPRFPLFGHVSVSGQVTAVAPFAPGLAITDVVAGSNGYLWIADQGNNTIWRFDPHTSAAKPYPLTGANGQLQSIALGTDGSIWATMTTGNTGGDPLIHLDLHTGSVQTYAVPGLTSLSYGLGPIVAAPDGSLWFAPGGNTEWIGQIDPRTGTIRTFGIPHEGYIASPQWITVGPDGNIWFVCNPSATSGDVVGRVTPNGQVTAYNLTIEPEVIGAGPDGNLWFSTAGNALDRITPGGVITQYPNLPGTGGVTLGPDGHLWVTYAIPKGRGQVASYIARIDHLP